MKLRIQLIILSLLTLSLPWAGCEYIREMENTLRDGQARNLWTTTKTIAHVLSYETPGLFQHAKLTTNNNQPDNNIYSFSLDSKILLDGYPDDWGALRNRFRYFPDQLKKPGMDNTTVGFISASNNTYIYLFVSVKDDRVVYHDPARGLVNGDRLQLLVEAPGDLSRRYILQTSAPGKITARYIDDSDSFKPVSRRESRIHGRWQDTREGFNIEIRIPRKLLPGHFNFALVDANDHSDNIHGWHGTWNTHTNLNNGLVIRRSDALTKIVEKFRQDNARIRVTDRQGWLLSSVGSPYKTDPQIQSLELNETLMAILNQIYHFIMYFSERSEAAIHADHGRLTGDMMQQAVDHQGSTAWYRPEKSNRAFVTATYPVTVGEELVGVVIADQSSDAILTLTNHALNRLITLSSIAMLLSAAGLLGFATYLSIRIRRLRNVTENIISADGIISDGFQPSTAGDELGDLSRSFATMHKRLQEYTQYLRTLASKLSHELRTPLAVVQSSLDNLNIANTPEEAAVYQQRARDGSERLGKIITALSEASRVEQSIQASETEVFDLRRIIDSSVDAYSDSYPQRQFVKQFCDNPCMINGSPELIVQMLDKLVDNAMDFSPEKSTLSISLLQQKNRIKLDVHNTGPLLPDHMKGQLFDSMVSVRENTSEKPHMGLGLYIVRLIAEAHHGEVHARNSRDGKGVHFTIDLPVLPIDETPPDR